jgi:hypothetical protein
MCENVPVRCLMFAAIFLLFKILYVTYMYFIMHADKYVLPGYMLSPGTSYLILQVRLCQHVGYCKLWQ